MFDFSQKKIFGASYIHYALDEKPPITKEPWADSLFRFANLAADCMMCQQTELSSMNCTSFLVNQSSNEILVWA